jgi:hypothetical protein
MQFVFLSGSYRVETKETMSWRQQQNAFTVATETTVATLQTSFNTSQINAEKPVVMLSSLAY